MKNIKSIIFISAAVINSIIGIICGFFKPIGFIYMGIPLAILSVIILFTAPWEVLVNEIKERRRIAAVEAALKAEAHKKIAEAECDVENLEIDCKKLYQSMCQYPKEVDFLSEKVCLKTLLCSIKQTKEKIKEVKWESKPNLQITMMEEVSDSIEDLQFEIGNLQKNFKEKISEYEASGAVVEITETVIENIPVDNIWDLLSTETADAETTEEAAKVEPAEEKSLVEKVKEAADAGDIEAIRKLIRNDVPGDDQLLAGIKALIANDENK